MYLYESTSLQGLYDRSYISLVHFLKHVCAGCLKVMTPVLFPVGGHLIETCLEGQLLNHCT